VSVRGLPLHSSCLIDAPRDAVLRRKRQVALAAAESKGWRDVRAGLAQMLLVHTAFVSEMLETTSQQPHPGVAGSRRVTIVFVHPKEGAADAHDVIAALARVGCVEVDGMWMDIIGAVVQATSLLYTAIGRPLFRVRDAACWVASRCTERLSDSCCLPRVVVAVDPRSQRGRHVCGYKCAIPCRCRRACRWARRVADDGTAGGDFWTSASQGGWPAEETG
jgi:hypothetical protein